MKKQRVMNNYERGERNCQVMANTGPNVLHVMSTLLCSVEYFTHISYQDNQQYV